MGYESGNGAKAHLRARKSKYSKRNLNDNLAMPGMLGREAGQTDKVGNSSPGIAGNSFRHSAQYKAVPLGMESAGIPLSMLARNLALEPRILLDAAGFDTAWAILDSPADIPAAAFGAAVAHGDNVVPPTGMDHPEIVTPAGKDGSNEPFTPAGPFAGEPAEGKSVVFMDGSLENLDVLVDGLGTGHELFILTPGMDGLEQMAAALQDRDGISEIHILSHGSAGELQLGSTLLTAQSISGHQADLLSVVGSALATGGDILIYGCDFGAGETGALAVQALSSATGADVAASDDLTGHAALGGDWDLEVRSGEIEAFAVSPLAWAGTLDLTITDVGAGGAGITGPAIDNLAAAMLGGGVTINSATYSGGAQQAATFVTGPGASFGSNVLTFGDGVIFSTGTAASVAGPNNQGGFTVDAPGIDGDADFNALAGNPTFDASFVEVTFTPDVPPGASVGDTGRMTMEIVFGSDEYNEYVYAGVNDTLAVIVNGVNQAVVPNGLAIGIDTINDAATHNPGFGSPALDPNPEHTAAGFESANPSLYVNNDTGAFNTQMDGFTITIPVTFDVIVGQQNTIKIGIADTGDFAWDSWMFVKADSAQTVIVAENDSVSTPTNIPFNIDVTANDYDLQGDTLTVTHILGQPVNPGDTVTLASGVDVTVEVDGTLTVEGDGVNTANDAFTYSISDGNGGTSTAFVNVNITAFNTVPVAVDDGPIPVSEDIPVSGNVITDAPGIDTDADGDPLTITDFAIAGEAGPFIVGTPYVIPGVGSFTIEPGGAYTFTPAADYNGPVPAITYTVSDPGGSSDTAMLTFADVTPVNDVPVMNLDPDNDSGTPGDPSDDGADDGGFDVTFTENQPTGAPIVDTDFTISDPEDDIVEVVVTLTNGQIGDTFDFPSVLPGNVTASVVPVATLTAPGVMTITFTGDASTTAADWQTILTSVTFTPSTNDVHNPDPADRNVTIEATDSAMASTGVLETVIHVVPVNDPPTLDLDDFNTSGINAGNYQGTYVENAAGAPISDGVVITDLDDTSLEGMTITLTNGEIGDILNIGTLPPGISLVGTAPADLAAPGTITIQLTGSATLADYQSAIAAITFTNTGEDPAGGVREITVVGTDGEDPTPTRTAFITVQPVNDPPEVVDPLDPGNPPADPNAVIPAQTGDDASVVTPLDAAQYFTDPDDTVLTYSLDPTAPSWLSINPATGEVTGTPPSDASQNSNTGTPGEYDVIIIAADPGGLTAQTTAVYTISNPAPDALDDDFATNENDPAITGDVLADNGNGADADPDGDAPLTVIDVTGNGASGVNTPIPGLGGGLFTITPTGGFTFSDNGDFEDLADGETRDATVTYTISDGQGGTDTATVTVTVTGTNDDPAVVPGSEIPDATGNDAEVITPIDVTGAFSDVDINDTLTYTATGLPSGLGLDPNTGIISGTIDGSASQNGNTGPATDGVYTIVVTADDGNGGIVSDTFTFTVSNVPPDAQDDALSGDEDSVTTGSNVLADNGSGADNDADGDTPLTVTQVGGNAADVGTPTAGNNGGLFTIDTNGDLTFDPNGDFDYLAVGETATTTITYELSDGEGGVDTATVTYTVTGVNDDPVPVDPLDPGNPPADPNAYIPLQGGTDNQPVTPLDVTQYVTDPDTTDTLTFAIPPAELPPGLTFDGTTISGTLAPNASQGGDDPVGNPGIYLIPLTVTDGNGGTFTTTITYDIANPPPVAASDAATGDEDSVTTGDLFADNGNGADSDPDGDSFTVTRVASGNSEAVLAGLSDGTGVGPATVSGSTGGTFTVNPDGTFSFDPGTDFQDLDAGESRVTEIVYQIDDGEGGADTAVVSYTVTGSNDGPVVIDPNDPFPNPNDPPVPADPDNVIPDQTGNDGEALTPLDISPYFADVDVEPLTFGFDPLDPDVPTWLTIDPVTGVITGTPPSDASQGGPNGDGVYPITLTATDPDGETVSTTVDFTITNIPPVAVDDLSTGDEDNDQSGNVITDPVTGDADEAPDSDPVAVTDVDGTPVSTGSPAVVPLTHGTLTMNEDGSWLFEPNAAANQLSDTDPAVVETVTYTIDDGNGGTDTATLEITINGINDPVQAVNPNDPSTDPTDPTYDPTNPTVIPDPDNLIADVSATDGETPATIPAGDYFGDAEGDTLTFSATGLPDGLTIDPVSGEISGTIGPDASQNGNGGPGIYDVVITAEDPQGNTATTTVTYTITNIPPTAQDDAVTHGEDGTASGDVFADNGNGVDQDTPPDSDPIVVSEVDGLPGNVGTPTAGDNGGLFLINPDGTYTFDPGSDFQDLDVGETRDTAITYTIDDGNGGTDTATVTVTVTGANDAPVVIDPNDPFPNPNDPPVPADPDNVIPDVSGSDGETLTPLDVSPYFVDVDGETLTYGFDPLDPDVPAWLSIDPVTGVITGTPPADASQGGPNGDGVYPITLTATDPDGETVTTTLDFTITNIPPTAQDDAVTHGEDGVATGDVFADNGNGVDQDTPPDADPILVSEVDGQPANVGTPTAGDNGGSFTINPDGTYTFDPGTDFQDLDDGESRDTSITYTIDDGNGGTDTATITVTVVGANDAPVVIDPNDPFPNPNEPPVPVDANNVIPDQAAEDASPLTPLDISPFFVDVDGEPLTFGFDPLDPDVPSWISIDPVTGVITGTPPSDASTGGPNGDGIYPLTVTATDPDGETVTTTVDFTITNPPPMVTGPLPDIVDTVGNPVSVPVSSVFDDPDGDVLTYTATGLPGGLTIDPATGEISGQIDPAAVSAAPLGDGVYSVVITADDGQGGSVSQAFTFTVRDPVNPGQPAPQPPVVGGSPGMAAEAGPLPSEFIVLAAVHDAAPLASGTGLFSDHPVTEAVNAAVALGAPVQLDANGYPVGEAVEWIENIRTELARSHAGAGDETLPGTYLGHDLLIGADASGSSLIVRTLAWQGMIHVEILGTGTEPWRVHSLDGVADPDWIAQIAPNLFVIHPNAGDDSVLLELDGAVESPLRITIQLDDARVSASSSPPEGNAGFSGQLRQLLAAETGDYQMYSERQT